MSFLDHHVLKAGQHEYTFIHSVYHWLFLFMFCLCLCLCFVFVCVLLGLICVWWTGWQKKFPPPLERGLSAALTTPCLVRTNLPLISTNCTKKQQQHQQESLNILFGKNQRALNVNQVQKQHQQSPNNWFAQGPTTKFNHLYKTNPSGSPSNTVCYRIFLQGGLPPHPTVL